MNNLDRGLKRLFKSLKEPSTASAHDDVPAPFGFSSRVVARWQGAKRSPEQPLLWLVLGRWGLVCASLILFATVALNTNVFRDDWSPALAVVEPVTQLVLAP